MTACMYNASIIHTALATTSEVGLTGLLGETGRHESFKSFCYTSDPNLRLGSQAGILIAPAAMASVSLTRRTLPLAWLLAGRSAVAPPGTLL